MAQKNNLHPNTTNLLESPFIGGVAFLSVDEKSQCFEGNRICVATNRSKKVP